VLIDSLDIFIPGGAGVIGGAMNALAGGGTFATLPALIALGLPANVANATSNVALLPGAGTSAWAFRHELGPVAGISVRLLAALTFAFGLVGSVLLVLTPTETFDVIIPWLLLFAFAVIAFGKSAADWLHERITIRKPVLLATQALLGVYGGYFGGGVGLITTAPLRAARQRPAARAVRYPDHHAGGCQPRRRHSIHRLCHGLVVGVPADAARLDRRRLAWREPWQEADSPLGAHLDPAGHWRNNAHIFHPGLWLTSSEVRATIR
jgi:hypothetical protein